LAATTLLTEPRAHDFSLTVHDGGRRASRSFCDCPLLGLRKLKQNCAARSQIDAAGGFRHADFARTCSNPHPTAPARVERVSLRATRHRDHQDRTIVITRIGPS